MLHKIWLPIKNVLKKIRDYGYRNFITEYLIPVKEQILLESAPAFADNTYSLYLEMLKRNYQKKYRIVWIVDSDTINPRFKRDDISYFNVSKKGLINKIKLNMLVNKSKYIITCNRFFKKKTNRQTIIHLNHGYPLKSCRKLKIDFSTADTSLTMSDFFIEENSYIFSIPKEKFFVMGSPRNDGLFNNINSKKLLGYERYKVIVWLPTFRHHMDGKRIDSDFNMPLGIPIIYDTKTLEDINEYLKKEKIILLLKPHFVADLSEIKAKTYSNFKIIYNSDLDNAGITLYELLSDSDGLITDYSSVYYDYLITQKPIGLTLDDYEEYNKATGFAYDYKEIIKGHYIYNVDDFKEFIKDLATGVDTYKKERMAIVKKLKLDLEGNYSKKVLDYLIDKFHI